MAEEFQLGRGNWWESSSSSSTSSSRNKFDSGISSTTPSAASTALSSMASNFDWPTEIVDIKATSSLHLGTVYPADSQKLHASESSLGGGEGRGVLSTDPNLQMMGLGLPSQGIDWNQPFFRGEKAGSGFRSILQEGLNLDANYQQEGASCQHDQQWTQKNMYHGNSDDSSVNDYKQQMNRGITLDHQPVFNANMSSNLENASAYGSPSNMLQGLLISDSHNQESNFTSARSMYNYPPYNPSNCDVNNPPAADVMPTSSSSSSWSKFPPFLRTSSPPKQQWPLQPPHGQSHFSNSTSPFWNSTSASMDDVRSGFIPSLLPQIANPTIDEKPKHTGEVRDISKIAKKTNVETSNKRPRNEAPSPMPAFKVRKEKMGDRITALQQLVSPFGKTDTASVLSEAIEYIKFLHEQVNVLSTPYMKSGAAMQHHQSTSDKSNNPEGVKQQDLRSRGLCLVPVSSTFPVTHETTVDFWTPSFGGTFR